MLSVLEFVSLTLVMSGLFGFILNYSNILNSLLNLEMLSLGVYLGLSIGLSYLGLEVYFMLYFLVMVVGEGVLGISLLIMMGFMYGQDYSKMLSNLVC